MNELLRLRLQVLVYSNCCTRKGKRIVIADALLPNTSTMISFCSVCSGCVFINGVLARSFTPAYRVLKIEHWQKANETFLQGTTIEEIDRKSVFLGTRLCLYGHRCYSAAVASRSAWTGLPCYLWRQFNHQYLLYTFIVREVERHTVWMEIKVGNYDYESILVWIYQSIFLIFVSYWFWGWKYWLFSWNK